MGRVIKPIGRERNEMISVDQHRHRILSLVGPLPASRVALQEAYGRVAAEDLRTTNDLPSFISSAMDGFAVRSGDLGRASPQTPTRLRLTGSVSMGRFPGAALGPGEAVAVPTGGVVPDGADAVVPIELCTAAGDEVLFHGAVVCGKNVRPAGEDLRAGEVIVVQGRRLGAAEIGLLASAGIESIAVRPAPRVGILSTGDELVRPGTRPSHGQIYDSNAYMLIAAVRSAGGVPVDLGHVPDDPDHLLDRLSGAVDAVDVLICSGGVSAGANDPVKRAFSPGDEVRCVSVAMQPGRPQAFGFWCGRPVFGLPGNPGAALVSFYVFVRPALLQMAGVLDSDGFLHAVLGEQVEASGDKCRFLPAVLTNREGLLSVSPRPAGGSNLLTPIAAADCLLEVPAGRLPAVGERCRVIPLRPLTG